MSNCFQQSDESLGTRISDVGVSVCPLKKCRVLFNVRFALLHSNSNTNPLRNPKAKKLTNTNAITLGFFFRFVSCTSSVTFETTPVFLRTSSEGDRRTANRSAESVDDQAFFAFKYTFLPG